MLPHVAGFHALLQELASINGRTHLYSFAVIYRHVEPHQSNFAVPVGFEHQIVPKDNRSSRAIYGRHANFPPVTHCDQPLGSILSVSRHYSIRSGVGNA
jgi:hypothetical protein